MKTALKGGNDKFSAMTLKPVPSPIDFGTCPRILKLWDIAHENGPKSRKRQIFSYDSQTCIGSNRPWELL